MGTILASTVISKAWEILQDDGGVRWTQAKMLEWLNIGQREIVVARPTAYVKNTAIQLVQGTKQTIPADGVLFLNLTRNMGGDGTIPGGAIRRIDQETLNAQIPNWHTLVGSEVRYFVFDPADPKTFYVFPQTGVTYLTDDDGNYLTDPDGNYIIDEGFGVQGYVEQVYSANPPEVAVVGDPISVDDIYEGALINYCLFRAYSKDAEETGEGARAAAYHQAFMDGLKTLGA